MIEQFSPPWLRLPRLGIPISGVARAGENGQHPPFWSHLLPKTKTVCSCVVEITPRPLVYLNCLYQNLRACRHTSSTTVLGDSSRLFCVIGSRRAPYCLLFPTGVRSSPQHFSSRRPCGHDEKTHQRSLSNPIDAELRRTAVAL